MNLTGEKFERLKVEEFARKDAKGRLYWKCICDCGNKVVVRGAHLISGHSKSCGCLQAQRTSAAKLKHGHGRKGSESSEYRSWLLAKTSDIPMCDRWEQSFESFLSDMGLKPTSKHSIERIDTKGIFEPRNSRWGIANIFRITKQSLDIPPLSQRRPI
jgi:hypothetical protein